MLSHEERMAIRARLPANKHEIYVCTPEAIDEAVNASPRLRNSSIRESWQKVRKGMEVGAGYYASAGDMRTLTKLVGDLGGITARVYVKTYGGKPHIILKGNPHLRSVLTGTKYGVRNAKVVQMGLGYQGAAYAAKAGGVVSVILMSAYRITDYVLTDEATLSSLIGSLATDVVKIGISTGAAIGAAHFVAGATFGFAVGPLVAVVFVGVVASIGLTYLDDNFKITERLIAALESFADDVIDRRDDIANGISDRVRGAVSDAAEQAVNSATRAVVDSVSSRLRRLTTPYPRLR